MSIRQASGSLLGELRRRLKFSVRAWWHRRAYARNESAALAHAPALAELDPNVRHRVLRTYLRRGLSAAHRAEAFEQHYRWHSSALSAPARQGIESGQLLRLAEPRDGLEFRLQYAYGMGREGELALHLVWRERHLMSAAFVVVEGTSLAADVRSRQRCLAVHALQGVPDASELLRELSRQCERLMPTALLVAALQGLAHGLGAETIVGVSGREHVYAGYRSRRRRVRLDYDSIWKASGGLPLGGAYWLLPREPRVRPPEEVDSRKRSQHLRRSSLKSTIFTALSAAAGSLLVDLRGS